jgi:hypothetical protein
MLLKGREGTACQAVLTHDVADAADAEGEHLRQVFRGTSEGLRLYQGSMKALLRLD